jgi:pimeloyl-ACP methyl ester carboxylesterase
MQKISTLAIALAALAAPALASAAEPAPQSTPTPVGVHNIVIVHDAFVDGSGWRVVHDILIHKGYHVKVVQESLTTLDEDVAAVREAVRAQDGPVVLVGHGYGGSVITVAGARDKVKALVYVAAIEPDIYENMAQLVGSMPAPSDDIRSTRDGHISFDSTKFGEDYAGDLSTNRTDFMAVSQPWATRAAIDGSAYAVAWHDKPSWGIVATEDRALSPDLQRWMYNRAGAKITEIKASHAVYISQPEAVAAVIEQAATSVK